MEQVIKDIFIASLKHITGVEGSAALGGSSIRAGLKTKTGKRIAAFFDDVLSSGTKGSTPFMKEFDRALESFVAYYTHEERFKKLRSLWERFSATNDDERKAQIIAHIFVPELTIEADEVLGMWRLNKVRPNPHPYSPTEVTLQLNALYSVPESIDPAVPETIASLWKSKNTLEMKHIADYDHPVPLFVAKPDHELEKCLDELETDLDFEKEMGVLPLDYRLPVTISISVTHDVLDAIASRWIEWLLQQAAYKNMRFILLSEKNVNKVKQELGLSHITVFSVFGKYAVHFNTLKYCQLLLEKSHGIRAGFKLDTDEGIRSRDLYRETGKTWLQTLCHPFWGGRAEDFAGRDVYLGVNEGEYINSEDIDRFGYNKAYKLPEVKPPKSFISQQILFFKDQAQSFVTALYNRFDKLEDTISHPVVKGGGYGIDNTALYNYTPFALTLVGRAEDQQFYFNGLAKRLRGIFHPDLRIAHYKQSVRVSESKQLGTKLLGDMYRILIFSHLAERLEIKKEIDPFPGLFAGKLARCQYFLNLVYQAFCFAENGNEDVARYLLEDGLPQLEDLINQIDEGEIRALLEKEEKQWIEFTETISSFEPEKIRPVIDSITII